jgi:hypothetical protein
MDRYVRRVSLAVWQPRPFVQVAEARQIEASINSQRQAYRQCAVRGALLYFLIDSLCILDHM